MNATATETPADGLSRANKDGSVSDAALLDLKADTPASEIKQRTAMGRNGPVKNADGSDRILDYVDARFVQERLDDVVGQANWQTKYEDTGNHGAVRCSIGIFVNGQWIWKSDVGVPSNIEPEKGAHSDAFKRAAVQWGIARDLYSNREPEPVADTGTVRDQVGGRSQRYDPAEEDGHITPGLVATSGSAECPDHGPMVHRTGVKNNKRWSGFFCQVRGCPTPPVWG